MFLSKSHDEFKYVLKNVIDSNKLVNTIRKILITLIQKKNNNNNICVVRYRQYVREGNSIPIIYKGVYYR